MLILVPEKLDIRFGFIVEAGFGQTGRNVYQAVLEIQDAGLFQSFRTSRPQQAVSAISIAGFYLSTRDRLVDDEAFGRFFDLCKRSFRLLDFTFREEQLCRPKPILLEEFIRRETRAVFGKTRDADALTRGSRAGTHTTDDANWTRIDSRDDAVRSVPARPYVNPEIKVKRDRLVRFVHYPQHKGIYFLNRKSTRLNSSHSQISYAVFC